MTDYSDFDIDRSTAQAWAEFQARLAEIISMIDDSGDLRIGTESVSDGTAPFVLFSSPERDLVRTEAAAVLGLPSAETVTATEISRPNSSLRALTIKGRSRVSIHSLANAFGAASKAVSSTRPTGRVSDSQAR